VQREFLEAYFQINRAYARLALWRKNARKGAGPTRERALLRAVEKAIRNREKVEDRYAPRGWSATPVYRDGYAVNIQFSDVVSYHASRQPITSSSSLVLRIPLPPGLRTRLCKS
jgi:hypothetical protein